MEFKDNQVGYLIYCTMAVYLLAFIATISRQKKLGQYLYYLGFFILVVAFGLRWYEVKHIPLQNMFEVFLCLGMLLPPISLFCRWILRIGGEVVDMRPAFSELVIANHRHGGYLGVGPVTVDRHAITVPAEPGGLGHTAKDNPS